MSDQNLNVTIRNIIESEEILKILTVPRRIPHNIRNDVAKILAEELLKGYVIRDHEAFIKRYGIFLNVIFALRGSSRWEAMKVIAAKNDLMPIIIMRMVLPLTLNVMEGEVELIEGTPEDVSRFMKAQGDMWEAENEELGEKENVKPDEALFNEVLSQTLSGKLSEINISLDADIRAMELLSLLFPGREFDYTVRELHKEFLSNLDKYAELVEKNDELLRIVEVIGRMETELGNKRMAKTKHGHSEMHSIRSSNDIQRMLPNEIVNLSDSELETLFYARFSESKLMTYDLRGRNMVSGPPKNRRKGPVIVLVDTSGSMFGEPEVIAKAVTLMVARNMIPEKRDVKVVLFSTRTEEISLTGKEKMGKEFLEFLSYTFGGGTDFNIALKEGVRAMREREWMGADLMFISDGYSIVNSPEIIMEWDTLKESNDARVFSVIINNDNAGGLEELSDTVYILDNEAIWGSGSDYVRMMDDLI